MRRSVNLLAALAIWLLAGCGPQQQTWRDVAPNAQGAGVSLTFLFAIDVLDRHPWREPIGGPTCLTYWIEARSVDGGWHELRPDQFRVGSHTPAEAVGRCNGEQLEPIWVDSAGRLVPVTVIFDGQHREHLLWLEG